MSIALLLNIQRMDSSSALVRCTVTSEIFLFCGPSCPPVQLEYFLTDISVTSEDALCFTWLSQGFSVKHALKIRTCQVTLSLHCLSPWGLQSSPALLERNCNRLKEGVSEWWEWYENKSIFWECRVLLFMVKTFLEWWQILPPYQLLAILGLWKNGGSFPCPSWVKNL